MEDITIIGAGVSGLTLAGKIKEGNYKGKIKLIDKNQDHFPRNFLIANPAETKSQRINLDKWAKERQIDFINDCVERVNLKRRKIYLKNSNPVDFNKLIVSTGLVSKKLSIKGEHREGFFYLSSIKPDEFNDILRISQEVCLYVSTWLGLKLALGLRSLGKEVRIISENLDFLGEDKSSVVDILEEKGIIVNLGVSVEEAVGEGKIKAVKILPLKVFSCQIFIVDSGLESNMDFFEEDIKIQDTFFSEYEGVYFLGDVNKADIENEKFFINNHDDSKQQSLIFADFLLNGRQPEFNRTDVLLSDIKTNIEKTLREGELWQSGLV